jgi:hypothetical protein
VFYVSPNPATNSITITIPGEMLNSQLEIINAMGQLMFNQQLDDEKNTLNIESIPKGIYFIRVQKSGIIICKKIIIN